MNIYLDVQSPAVKEAGKLAATTACRITDW